jgi:hypothetical protein
VADFSFTDCTDRRSPAPPRHTSVTRVTIGDLVVGWIVRQLAHDPSRPNMRHVKYRPVACYEGRAYIIAKQFDDQATAREVVTSVVSQLSKVTWRKKFQPEGQ